LVEAAFDDYFGGQDTVECSVQKLSDGEVLEGVFGLAFSVKNVGYKENIAELDRGNLEVGSPNSAYPQFNSCQILKMN